MKKLLATLLCVMMVVVFMPTMAFAEGGEAEVGTKLPEAGVDGVIVLDNNYTVTTLSTTARIDLNGYNLTVTGETSIKPVEGETLSITSSKTEEPRGTLTFTSKGSTTKADINPQKNGTVTVSNINIVSPNSVFFPQGDAARVNVTNCNVKAGCYCVGTNASTTENAGVEINLKDSTLTAGGEGSEDKDNCTVMINVDGKLNIDHCTITGDRQTVLVRAGDATITNSTLINTGAYVKANPDDSKKYHDGGWESGNEVPAAAIVVGNNESMEASYAAPAKVEVTNCTVISKGDSPALYVDANATYNSSIKIAGEKTEVTGTIMKTGVKDGKIEIIAGTFSDLSEEDAKEYVPDGVVTEPAEGDGLIIGITSEKALVDVNGAGFESLEKALVNLAEGATITLLGDVEPATKIVLPAGATLDGNGYSITATEKIENGGFIETSSDNVTIQNITINTDGNAKHGVQFYCAKGGTLENATVNGGYYTSVIVNGSEVTIENCTLNPEKDAYANIEYGMGSGVTELPEITIKNVAGSPEAAFVYVDKDTLIRANGGTPGPDVDISEEDVNKAIEAINGKVAGAEVTYMYDGTVVVPGTMTYTITFNANGGTVDLATAVTNEKGQLTSFPTPTRSGSYTFKGWYTAASGGEKVTEDTVFTAATTIYAQWTYTGGGGYYPGYYPTVQNPTIEASEGVTVVKGGDGTTATITVAAGYELVDVTVNGISKGKVTTLTGLKTGDKVVVTAQKIGAADIAAQIAEVRSVKLVARSAMSRAQGKKAVKVTWYASDGAEVKLDGVEIFRSVKRYSGFGKKPIFKTTKAKYYNTAIKVGTKYYYKVRGYKVIDSKKVYTDWSSKAWRTVK